MAAGSMQLRFGRVSQLASCDHTTDIGCRFRQRTKSVSAYLKALDHAAAYAVVMPAATRVEAIAPQ